MRPAIALMSEERDVQNTSNIHKAACYDLRSLEWDKRTNSCIRVNTRELNRELFTK